MPASDKDEGLGITPGCYPVGRWCPLFCSCADHHIPAGSSQPSRPRFCAPITPGPGWGWAWQLAGGWQFCSPGSLPQLPYLVLPHPVHFLFFICSFSLRVVLPCPLPSRAAVRGGLLPSFFHSPFSSSLLLRSRVWTGCIHQPSPRAGTCRGGVVNIAGPHPGLCSLFCTSPPPSLLRVGWASVQAETSRPCLLPLARLRLRRRL